MAAILHTGNVLALDMLKALGIDSRNVVDMSINLRADEIASVTITRALDCEEFGKLVSMLERYAVVRMDEPKQDYSQGGVAKIPVGGYRA